MADPKDTPLPQGFYREPATQVEAEGVGADDLTIVYIDGDPGDATVDPSTGAVMVENGDGSVSIDLSPPISDRATRSTDHDANLAEDLDQGELQRIATELLEGIEADDRSRQQWLETRAKGIEMLGFKIEEPRGDSGASTAPVEGMSTVRHPVLAEAVIRFQSNAAAELLPAWGPVKVRNDSPPQPPGTDAQVKAQAAAGLPPTIGHNGGPALDGDDEGDATDDPIAAALAAIGVPNPADPAVAAAAPVPAQIDGDDLAEALEKDFNRYLTVTDKGYRPDTDRMLFQVGFGGCGFKKVYYDPVRRMPISRSVDAADLIVSNSAHDFEDAGRVTHRIMMRKATLIRMRIAGVYRKVENLTEPYQTVNPVEQAIAATQGFEPLPARPQDQQYTIYESYVELDIAGYEHVGEDGEKTGLPLPYRVTIEKDSRQILEIRRNWRKDDENCLPKGVFVKFPFVPALGFYEVGLLQMIGNATRAITGAWREMLDSGMFANFPGFLYAQVAGRQNTNEFRIPPGGGVAINTGGKAIGDVVMRLPYNDVTPGLSALVKDIETTAMRVGGTAEAVTGEGKQDAPVGTTLALIEQATKMLAAVHVRLHAAQSEEFQLLKELFIEDPASFWRSNRHPAKRWSAELFLKALADYDLTPAADPNVPSHMHRIMKAMAIGQLQQLNPGIFDPRAVARRIMSMIDISDPDSLFAPPAPPPGPPQIPVDPNKQAMVQAKQQQIAQAAQEHAQDAQAKAASEQQQNQAREVEIAQESADRAADRASRERVAVTREHTEQVHALADMAKQGLVPPDVAVDAVTRGPAPPAGGIGAPPPGGGPVSPPVAPPNGVAPGPVIPKPPGT